MNPQEIKLPTFPRYAKDEDKAFMKFYSPFHCVVAHKNCIEFEIDEDYDNTLLTWRYFLDEKFTECTEAEFVEKYDEVLQKLLQL
jgi:hypothetical protein